LSLGFDDAEASKDFEGAARDLKLGEEENPRMSLLESVLMLGPQLTTKGSTTTDRMSGSLGNRIMMGGFLLMGISVKKCK
jgi:hypothetical protein